MNKVVAMQVPAMEVYTSLRYGVMVHDQNGDRSK